MTFDQMIKCLQFHATYFESIYAERAAEEIRAVVRALRVGQDMRDALDHGFSEYMVPEPNELICRWDQAVGVMP